MFMFILFLMFALKISIIVYLIADIEDQCTMIYSSHVKTCGIFFTNPKHIHQIKNLFRKNVKNNTEFNYGKVIQPSESHNKTREKNVGSLMRLVRY
ncbi:hypothetical protein BDF14DRAFT_1786919, partial [Spinellus fusiger]